MHDSNTPGVGEQIAAAAEMINRPQSLEERVYAVVQEEKAFAFLARVSRTGNIKLEDGAQELVTQTDTRYTIKEDA